MSKGKGNISGSTVHYDGSDIVPLYIYCVPFGSYDMLRESCIPPQ